MSANDEARMTKSKIMTKFEARNRLSGKRSSLGFGHSFVIRHSDFVIK